MVWLNIIVLVAGFFCLLKGADYLVDGSSSLAKRFGISSLTIGLTVVAFGTSTPEFMINIMSWVAGTDSLSVGNIIGSNLVNLLLALGITAYFFELDLIKPVKREALFTLISAVLIALLLNNHLGPAILTLTRFDGIVLLVFFGVFLFTTFKKKGDHQEIPIQRHTYHTSLMFIIFGIVGLALGGWLIVYNSAEIARVFGISEILIGLTVISIGTTLPELVTSLTAAKKKEPGMAVGNILGSCIFNTLVIFGFGSVLRPISINPLQNIDLVFYIIAATLVLVIIFTGGRYPLKKEQGRLLMLLYVLMTIFFILREIFL